ncbi:MAG: hypothetical protein AAGA21_09340 [Pseudomonadota bacterium]
MSQCKNRNLIVKSLLTAGLMMAMLPWAEDAHAACGATINGAPMTVEECNLAMQIYGGVQPGHYWMDANGTWGVMGDPTPRGNIQNDAYAYQSRGGVYGGSGERSGNGSWVHRQDDLLGGGAVGGDGNGCYYAEGWSNC